MSSYTGGDTFTIIHRTCRYALHKSLYGIPLSLMLIVLHGIKWQ
ncbi:hypothetical protein N8696_00350 [bacterium]|nr:hypothetical protein [bacterium]